MVRSRPVTAGRLKDFETPRRRSASCRVIAKLPERGRSAGPIQGYGRWCPGAAVTFEGGTERTTRKRRTVTKITFRRSRRRPAAMKIQDEVRPAPKSYGEVVTFARAVCAILAHQRRAAKVKLRERHQPYQAIAT